MTLHSQQEHLWPLIILQTVYECLLSMPLQLLVLQKKLEGNCSSTTKKSCDPERVIYISGLILLCCTRELDQMFWGSFKLKTIINIYTDFTSLIKQSFQLVSITYFGTKINFVCIILQLPYICYSYFSIVEH